MIYIKQTSQEITVTWNEYDRASIRPARNPIGLEKHEKSSTIILHAIILGHKTNFDSIEVIKNIL